MKTKLINGRFLFGKRLLKIVMKTFIFLLCTTIFALSPSNAVSQNSKVKIDKDMVLTVDEVFDLIMDQTDYKFFYEEGIFKDLPKVALKKGTIRTSKLLNQSLSQGNLDIAVTSNNAIIIKEKTQNNQQLVVSGTITDENAQPLAGASIIEKGTTNGAQADFDGKFNITVTNASSVLEISYLGYTTQDIVVGDQTTINVVLKEATSALDEVVVVGYGTQKKVNLTGAVGYVSSEVLEDVPIANTTEGLQGLLPGLNLNFSSGEPGRSASINIRGWNGLGAKQGPLVLVDGAVGNIDYLNPQDIESVSVLKDAASAAIYGARAANGVILVTTKKGKKGKTRVDLSTTISFNRPGNMPKMLSSSQHIEAMQETGFNWVFTGSPSVTMDDWLNFVKLHEQDPVNNPSILILKDWENRHLFVANTDWAGALVKDQAMQQKHDFSISGGNDNITYRASLGYLEQEGVFKVGEDKYRRINANLSLNAKTNKWLEFDFLLRYSNLYKDEPNQYGSQEAWHNLYRMPTWRPIKNDMNRVWTWDAASNQYVITEQTPSNRYVWDNNPIAYIDEGGRDIYKTNDFVMAISPTIKISDKLKLKGDFLYNPNFYQNNWYWKTITFEIWKQDHLANYVTAPSRYNQAHTNRFHFNINTYAEYENTFGKHYVKGMVGYNQEWREWESTRGTYVNILKPDQPYVATGDPEAGLGADHWAVRGGFFRANYIYDDKYLLEVNGRYDGTSRFPKEYRFGFFPSFSLGWRASQEQFMDFSENWLSDLKFRFSYGELGNQNIGLHAFESVLNTSDRIGITINGTRPNGISLPGGLPASPNVTWETSKTTNYGVDMAFLNNRLSTSFDYFVKDVEDLLTQPTNNFPNLIGASVPSINFASIRSKGWELNVNWRDNIDDDFSYRIGVNVSDFTGEVTKVDNPTNSLNASFYEGQVLGEIWGYETEGIFQSDAEAEVAWQGGTNDQSALAPIQWQAGDIKYKDLNGDGVIDRGDLTTDNPGDLRVIGNSSPRYRFGIDASAEYKNFDFRMFWQGVGKRNFVPSRTEFFPLSSRYENIQEWQLDYWTPENPDAYFPRAQVENGGYNKVTQTRFLQNAKYIRLKNVTIGYTLPKDILDKMGVDRFRIYVSGQNLWESHGLYGPHMDPEGTDGYWGAGTGKTYPFQRTYALGLNVSF